MSNADFDLCFVSNADVLINLLCKLYNKEINKFFGIFIPDNNNLWVSNS